MRRLAALLIVLSLVAACSGDDDAPEVAEPETTSTSTTTEPAVLYEGYESEVYADPAHWLCRGDVADDPCDTNMDATIVDADGTTELETFTPVADADVDCFYVYPTISYDDAVNSDLEPHEAQEIFGVRHQAARLGSVCRLFAPVYRQVTMTMLLSRMGGEVPPGDVAASGGIAYDDVVDAWKHYMANDNGGRGVVLIGHSQGAGHLLRLLVDEVDDEPEVRERLVSALLLGNSVPVPAGENVGGALDNIPLCRADDDLGCVVSYSGFRSTAPPPANSFFGRAEGGEAACTNPAALGGGSGELHPYLSSTDRSLVGGADNKLEFSPGLTVDTEFVTLPGLLSAECINEGGFSYLSITVHGDPATPRVDDFRGDLTPEWGLHLVDVSLTMGDLVAVVTNQVAAYTGS